VSDVEALPQSRRILYGYFTLSGLYTLSAALIWGVNTLFLLSAGLSFLEVFIANAAFSAGMVVFEIPTAWSPTPSARRVSFLLSVSVLGVTTLMYVGLAQVEAGVVAFSLVSVLMGLGFTFYSGAMEAWLVDALHATGYHGLLDRVFARGQQITGAAMLVGTVGEGSSARSISRSRTSFAPCSSPRSSSSRTSSCTTSASRRDASLRASFPARWRATRERASSSAGDSAHCDC
jgi:hypothetical protein